MISTYNYQKQNPNQFDYKGHQCKEFELYENVGGQIKVKTSDKLEFSGIEYENIISFNNVKSIEILTEYGL